MYYALHISDQEFMSHDHSDYVVASKNKQMLERLAKDFEIAGGTQLTATVETINSTSLDFAKSTYWDYNFASTQCDGLGGSPSELEALCKKIKKDEQDDPYIESLRFEHSLTMDQRLSLIRSKTSPWAVDHLLKKKKLRKATKTGKIYTHPERYKNLME